MTLLSADPAASDRSGRERRSRSPTAFTFIGLGIALILFGVFGLLADIPWIATPFYAWAWWGLIFILDGHNYLRRGSSLLTTRRRHIAPILFCSVTFWVFFELLNMRFRNWYYVGVIGYRGEVSYLYAGLFTFLAFSTVFMGMFEMYEALCARGLFDSWQGTARKLPRWMSYAIQGVGLLMAGLAVLFPYYLSPLIWGSVSFLLDPWNYRHGARSILSEVEQRRWKALARLFLAGLICGLFWESMNFHAPQKWIYTVRGLETFKLFEMPLLGFLGFPGLMIDALAAYSFLAFWLLGNETWEHPDDLPVELLPRPPVSRRVLLASVPFQILFWAIVGEAMVSVNVGSVEFGLADLPALRADDAARLRSQGVRTPFGLLRAAGSEDDVVTLSRAAGIDPHVVARAAGQARLYTFKGIGAEEGPLLNWLGIHRVEDLESWEPGELHGLIRALNAERGYRWTPRIGMVRVWVLSARGGGLFAGKQPAPVALGRPTEPVSPID